MQFLVIIYFNCAKNIIQQLFFSLEPKFKLAFNSLTMLVTVTQKTWSFCNLSTPGYSTRRRLKNSMILLLCNAGLLTDQPVGWHPKVEQDGHCQPQRQHLDGSAHLRPTNLQREDGRDEENVMFCTKNGNLFIAQLLLCCYKTARGRAYITLT